MNPVVEHIVNVYKNMPLSRKIVSGVLIFLTVAGFAAMFIWANKVEYQTAYTRLSAEDAAAITEMLKEKRIPYRLAGGGSAIMVPAEQVYDVRLALAASGLPKGGGVGYEIFDKTDFGTTEFVQNVNRQRALQGELARTIKQFEEVLDAKVMIVLPRESVFIDEAKPPSASVLLKLKSDLDKGKIDAVVHLVSSAVQDLKPNLVTVVDTSGRVLFKGISEEEKTGLLADAQLRYKDAVEKKLTDRIQSMLERIVGQDKAIVRVTTDMDFDRVDVNEEVFDPDVQVVRSRKTLSENSAKQADPAGQVSSVNPVAASGNSGSTPNIIESSKTQNDTVNYEISRTVRRVVKPVAVLKRLSVAAVIDGNYKFESTESGERNRIYVPRNDAEMDQFRKIVEKAMGYDEDRGDQVSVECFPFSASNDFAATPGGKSGWEAFRKDYGRIILNGLLIVLLFLLIVRPIVKTVKEIQGTVQKTAFPDTEGEDGDHLLSAEGATDHKALPQPENMAPVERAVHYAREDVDRTTNIIKTWLNEAE